jgi:hypothetical protein
MLLVTARRRSDQTQFPACDAKCGQEFCHGSKRISEQDGQFIQRQGRASQSEAALAVEFARKMASARSCPDAATVYQEWADRQLKLAVEDASYAISTGEVLMDMGSRLLEGENNGKGSMVPA